MTENLENKLCDGNVIILSGSSTLFEKRRNELLKQGFTTNEIHNMTQDPSLYRVEENNSSLTDNPLNASKSRVNNLKNFGVTGPTNMGLKGFNSNGINRGNSGASIKKFIFGALILGSLAYGGKSLFERYSSNEPANLTYTVDLNKK